MFASIAEAVTLRLNPRHHARIRRGCLPSSCRRGVELAHVLLGQHVADALARCDLGGEAAIPAFEASAVVARAASTCITGAAAATSCRSTAGLTADVLASS